MSMAEYRDFGSQGSFGAGYSEEVDTSKVGQVYAITHDRAGNLLPYHLRSFIGFTFGGRGIEEFNLISTTGGEMMERELSASFEDLATTYDVIDGQFYHGTHYKTNSLTMHLFTDGMDLRLLEDFKNWFAGGKTRELILAEHPNRAIQARVALPPSISMIPFEKPITITIAGSTLNTSTTEWRGSIEVEFIMDDPYWYSVINMFGRYDSGSNLLISEWQGKNYYVDGNALKDVLKIVHEDGVPINDMIKSPMFFGGDLYAGGSTDNVLGKIAEVITEETYAIHAAEPGYWQNGEPEDGDDIVFPNGEDEEHNPIYAKYYRGAVIASGDPPTGGVVAGAFVTTTSETNVSIPSGVANAVDYYYAGTAPAPTILEFTLPLTLDDNGYIESIASSYHKNNDTIYNTIILESKEKLELRFTTPSLLSSYNKLIYLLKNASTSATTELLLTDIRETIRHPVIREAAAAALNALGWAANTQETIITEIKNLFSSNASMTVTLNSKTGEALADITYANNKKLLKENVGDMIYSNHLYLTERNYFNKYYEILAWAENERTNAHRLYHDFPHTLTNVKMTYKYMYY